MSTAPPTTAGGERLARLAFALVRFPELWIALIPGVYGVLAVASPELAGHGHGRAGAFVFALFRGLCHQMPSRSLFVAGHPMAVCARCFALAAGLVLGAGVAGRVAALEAPRPDQARRWRAPFWGMCLAAVPMALDGFSQLFGLRESTNTLRVLTGALLGLTVAFWVVPHLYDAFDEQRRNYFNG